MWLTVDGLAGLRLVTNFETTTNPIYRLWRHALPDGLGLPAGTVALRAVWYGLLAAPRRRRRAIREAGPLDSKRTKSRTRT